MIDTRVLKNNLKTVILPLEGTEAVTVLILVGTGSRYETLSQRGVSHFLEHMFFKGGKRYKTSRDVARAIDSVGGDFNAFTGKEYTGYYVKTAKGNFHMAIDVLSDMLLSAKFDPVEIEKERGVILEEYNLYQDTPLYQIGWDFEQLLFGDQPLGWDQIGTKERIKSFERADFVDYKKEHYTAFNTTIIIAGNINEAEAERKLQEFFNLKKSDTKKQPIPFKWPKARKRLSIKDKKTEQGHLVMGFPGVAFGDEREFAARVLAIILGGNMSSRMFTRIRDELGLCYSIRTSTDHFSDVGVISTHAGVDLSRFVEAAQAIKEEYQKCATEGVGKEELENAKSFLRGKITLRLEDSEEMASFIGTQIVHKGEAMEPKELFAKIDQITREDVNGLAQELFTPENLALATIGPFKNLEETLQKEIIA